MTKLKNAQKVGYLLFPPTWQFLGDFGSFVLHVIICALRWGICCPIQLAPPTWQFLEIFGTIYTQDPKKFQLLTDLGAKLS
jgi:hypothetical protein